MTTPWTLTFDASDAPALAAFWAVALGYVPAPPPAGFASWEEWYERFDVPAAERDELASIADPEGVRPGISFLRVPEPKTAKNRVHLDVQAGGGRAVDQGERWTRITATVDRLTTAGGRVVRVDARGDGTPDHVVMTDPEGNEFCVV
ncbi:VOC family protein [Kineosporia succinea]|uniref:Catechol 2,3-dioxygenase-like lactoylglutathione lyase family enzyme n=1 Tax=Kineosporia succinea TaxID=84632 RepID=A0ABT9P868_9ACTN|nr:VOC family protein [Kineosporia succinea]MDP9828897.1 catechol 2,3-dioxygenase-like lactoylglutathione lyase family enzyme [Kineosporia succinea]